MEMKYFRKVGAFFYVALVVLCTVVGFQYSNDSDDKYRENFTPFSKHWTVNDSEVALPYGSSEEHFIIKNILPYVYGDQFVVVQAYYDTFTVYIDGKEILTSTENVFMGKTTDAGKKEFWIPLWEQDTGKEIAIDITMQREIYGASISQVFITTRAEYAVRVLKENIASMLVFATFTVTGLIEIILAAMYARRPFTTDRKMIFEALLYAGLFSVVSAQWVINDCRLPFIVFGHIVGYSIITIIAFLLMPLLFLRMQICLYLKKGLADKIVNGFITITCFMALLLALLGFVNWGDLIYLGQFFCFLVLIVVGYYSITDIVGEDNSNLSVSYANVTFVLLAILALVLYINSILSSYIEVIIFDLHLYVLVQVVLIYKRINTSIKEEQEYIKKKTKGETVATFHLI